MPTKVGIVIVSYNASAAVRVTLASLRRARNMTLFKVILVDNASTNEERRVIRKAFDKHVSEGQLNWEYIQLKKNLGFSGGNNVGIKKFLKDTDITHVCLLNSDVILSDFWLDRLVAKKSQAVSAVTNKAYSEQCVPADYNFDLGICLDWETDELSEHCFRTINNFSQNWHHAWRGNVVTCDVTFFIVLLSRQLIENIGLLDQTFFPGGYEDDDYCERIKAAGVDIHLARDIYIHHFGSASFGQLQQQYFNKRAVENKSYLEKKHNFVWRRRPEKPITSYMMDIVYALKGLGDHDLQLVYHKLYSASLTGLINHVDKEFTAIYYSHLLTCGHVIPEQLLAHATTAAGYTDTAAAWEVALGRINRLLENLPRTTEEIEQVEKELKTITDAVYAKAECNLGMVEFLREVGVFGGAPVPTAKGRNLLQKARILVQKGLPIFIKLKGVVFFGGYPYAEREKDGYFQRIRSIDALVQDQWRIYVDHGALPSKDSWYDRPEPNVIVLHMNNHRSYRFMRWLVLLCVLRCRKIYFHSVLRMQDGGFGKLMRWPGITRLIDIHGVVPEEFRYHNDFFSARIYDAHEELAIKNSDHIILVSDAMKQYMQQKYQDVSLGNRLIILPIFPGFRLYQDKKPLIGGKPVVVYAGGTHKWQQIPRMIDAVAATAGKCIHKLYCPNPAEMIPHLPEKLRAHPDIIIDSKPFSELLVIYETCHYGFILREDIVVNHAACPTKLIEYVAMGIVPIVDCEKIGDFKALGMQYITLKDFIGGKLPDQYTRAEMANANFKVYEKLQQVNSSGKQSLIRAFANIRPQVHGNVLKRLYLKTRHRVGVLLPSNSALGRLIRRIWSVLRGSRSKYKNDAAAQTHVISAPLPEIAPCEIMFQVDNFMVGGLENVVLDQLHIYQNAGIKVALIVLGEAGNAARRAENDGVPVYKIPFHPQTYRQVLQKASPKLIISHYSINGAEICSKMGVPFMQVIQNTYMWFTADQAYNFAKTAKHTTAFIAASEYARDYSVARLGVAEEKCFVIPNSIDLNSFKKMDWELERTALRTRYGLIENDNFTFLSVGSINHQKNHICSVRAFDMALKDMPGAKLIILGKLYENELWNEIRTYVVSHGLENDIIYAGESDNPPAYYAMADAFLHGAFFEGGPLSLLEAVAANLPIVTTSVGLAKHFKNRKGFHIVPPPIDIIDYYGPIWELKSTLTCERNIAAALVSTYQKRVRPDLREEIIEMFDRHHTYKLYLNFTNGLLETGKTHLHKGGHYWPDILESDQDLCNKITDLNERKYPKAANSIVVP